MEEEGGREREGGREGREKRLGAWLTLISPLSWVVLSLNASVMATSDTELNRSSVCSNFP